MPVLTNQQLATLRKVAARCNECGTFIEYAEKLGFDVEEHRLRWEDQKERAKLGMEINELMK